MITTIDAVLAATVYLLGGAFILFIYEAYTHTHQKNLLVLSIGMFIFIFGSKIRAQPEGLPKNNLLNSCHSSIREIRDKIGRRDHEWHE